MTATRLVSVEALRTMRQAAYDALDAHPDDDDYALCDRIVDGVVAALPAAECEHAALPAAPAEPAWDCPTCGAPAVQSVGGEWVSRWYSLQRMLSDEKPVGLEALQTAAGVLGMRLVDNAEPAPSVMNLMERKVASGESGTLDLSPPAEDRFEQPDAAYLLDHGYEPAVDPVGNQYIALKAAPAEAGLREALDTLRRLQQRIEDASFKRPAWVLRFIEDERRALAALAAQGGAGE